MNHDEIDDFLEHFGVKGMRWGVRKEAETSGRPSSQPKPVAAKKVANAFELTVEEKAVLAKLAPHGYTEERMRAMYGPGSPGGPPENGQRLTEKQKKALKIGAGVAAGAAVLGGLYLLDKKGKQILREQAGIDPFAQFDPYAQYKSPNLREFIRTSDAKKFGKQAGYTLKDIENLSTESVHLPVGSILKRVSTTPESSIRPDGFFAAYKDEDVGRYKAVLPIYWKLWGINPSDGGGHIVNLRANSDIKAPSPRETFEMFVDFIGLPGNPGNGQAREINAETARRIFPAMSAEWVRETPDSVPKAFLDHLRGKGYNAVVDLNDAGSLADSPLRILDGKLFDLAGTERLTATDISAAQETVLQLVHAILKRLEGVVMGDMKSVDSFLEHFGVKGMKWGVRNESRSSGVSRKTDRDARKDAEEFATAKAFHGKGAGTRRKLINQTVDAKKKRDPNYAKAFDGHLSRQDQAKHVSKAVSQRKSIDRREKTKQRTGYLARRFTGEMGTQAAFTAAAVAGVAFLASPQGRKIMSQASGRFSDLASNASNSRKQRQGADYLADYFRRNG